ANTALQVLELADGKGLAIADAIATGAREVALATLAGGTDVDVVVVSRAGKIIGTAR
ncbi:MAG: cobalt-precorrin-5B (C(1))-methyltransferase, partial [Rhodospirillaceae bacterium]|nr:cobalt-precorrin-5B (C(1))-methyltransferase [Rhodospirillaceae bacterium]